MLIPHSLLLILFILHYCWYLYWYNQKQSSRGVLRESCAYKFRKIHKKKSALESRFQWSCRSTASTFIKKDTTAQVFYCEFCEISFNSFFIEHFTQLLLHDHSFCLLSYHNLLPRQKRCHTYFLAEHFFGLFCRLATRMSSIFQTFTEVFQTFTEEWAQYFKISQK